MEIAAEEILKIMTVKELKELLEPLPDNATVTFHGYDKGCGLHSYRKEDVWTYPKGVAASEVKCFVINPGETYDGRRPSSSANAELCPPCPSSTLPRQKTADGQELA